MALPAPPDEDAFVAQWRDGSDVDALIEVVGEAVDARRLMLAARLAGLLPDDVDDPAVERARRAAKLVLVPGLDPHDVSWSAFEEAARELHVSRVARAKLRQRRAADGDDRRVGRLDGRRRHRRKTRRR